MTEPPLIQKQHQVLRNLEQLSAERVKAEAAAESNYHARNKAAEKEFPQLAAAKEALKHL